MHNGCGVEAEHLEGYLNTEANHYSCQYGADAKGSSKQSSNDDNNNLKAATAHPYRKLSLLGKHHHEAVPRPSPKSRRDVVEGSYANDKQATYHLYYSEIEVGKLGKYIQSKQKVHEQAYENHIEQGP